ncbi:MAG: relaxase/mobilization nuclease domain-containing protein [Cognatishimia sp.]
MIVKSMSRKEPSFGQLVGYIERGASGTAWRIRHNLLARNLGGIRDEFAQNGDLLQRRKNGVYLYHEIISITRAQGVSLERQKTALREIAERYIEERCQDNQVFGNLHEDQEHSLHYHLIISANPA